MGGINRGVGGTRDGGSWKGGGYRNEVMLIRQDGNRGFSRIIDDLDMFDRPTYTESNFAGSGLDLEFKICTISMRPSRNSTQIIGGSTQIIGGKAKKSSGHTNPNKAIDGNLNQRWDGGSISETLDERKPWWEWTLEQEEEVDFVKVFNFLDLPHRLGSSSLLRTKFQC